MYFRYKLTVFRDLFGRFTLDCSFFDKIAEGPDSFCHHCISNLIDGTSGESNITNLWKKHFCNILNANTCDSDLKNEIMTKLENIQRTDDMTVSCIDISNLISQLKCGKAAGSDDLCAEYFKFAHNKLHILLSMCFTLFFTHSYLPATTIETIIVPIVKKQMWELVWQQ